MYNYIMFLHLLILSFFGIVNSNILPATITELNLNNYLGQCLRVTETGMEVRLAEGRVE